jgi:hypothetical protein
MILDATITHRTLLPLVGMPLTAARRQGSMLALTFGELREVPAVLPRHAQEMETIGDYFLDLQCSWRLTHAERGIVVGADDLYVPAGQPKRIPDDWHYDGPQGNHLSEQITSWRASLPLTVMAVETDVFGGVVFSLADGYTLQIFPSHHHDGEYWRLFTPDLDVRHFVVTGRGIDPDDD